MQFSYFDQMSVAQRRRSAAVLLFILSIFLVFVFLFPPFYSSASFSQYPYIGDYFNSIGTYDNGVSGFNMFYVGSPALPGSYTFQSVTTPSTSRISSVVCYSPISTSSDRLINNGTVILESNFGRNVGTSTNFSVRYRIDNDKLILDWSVSQSVSSTGAVNYYNHVDVASITAGSPFTFNGFFFSTGSSGLTINTVYSVNGYLQSVQTVISSSSQSNTYFQYIGSVFTYDKTFILGFVGYSSAPDFYTFYTADFSSTSRLLFQYCFDHGTDFQDFSYNFTSAVVSSGTASGVEGKLDDISDAIVDFAQDLMSGVSDDYDSIQGDDPGYPDVDFSAADQLDSIFDNLVSDDSWSDAITAGFNVIGLWPAVLFYGTLMTQVASGIPYLTGILAVVMIFQLHAILKGSVVQRAHEKTMEAHRYAKYADLHKSDGGDD